MQGQEHSIDIVRLAATGGPCGPLLAHCRSNKMILEGTMQAAIVEPTWIRDVGRIMVEARLENLSDLALLALGNLSADKVRACDIWSAIQSMAANG